MKAADIATRGRAFKSGVTRPTLGFVRALVVAVAGWFIFPRREVTQLVSFTFTLRREFTGSITLPFWCVVSKLMEVRRNLVIRRGWTQEVAVPFLVGRHFAITEVLTYWIPMSAGISFSEGEGEWELQGASINSMVEAEAPSYGFHTTYEILRVEKVVVETGTIDEKEMEETPA